MRYFETKKPDEVGLKMHQYIATLPVFSSFMKFCVTLTNFVERHIDVVLEVLQVVGSKKKIYETYIFTIGRFTRIRMVALLMTELFNFTTIDEKNEL